MNKKAFKESLLILLVLGLLFGGVGGCYQFQATRFNDNYGTHFTWYDIAMGLHKQYRGLGQP